MKLSERLRSSRNHGDKSRPGAGPPPEHFHIDRNGELVIDLREPAFLVGSSQPTTEMRCPQCTGELRIDSVDNIARLAEMRCLECGFRFPHRLTTPS